MKKKNPSLSNLLSLVLPGLQGAVISKMMGRTELILCEGMFPCRFVAVGVFLEKKKLSLLNLHSLVLPGLQGAVISKMIGRTKLKVLEAMFTGRFPTDRGFQANNVRKGNFLSSLRSLDFSGLQAGVMSKMMGRKELKLFGAMFPSRFATVSDFQTKKWSEREFSMERNRIYSMQSSLSCFARPLGCCNLQNDGSYETNALRRHVS